MATLAQMAVWSIQAAILDPVYFSNSLYPVLIYVLFLVTLAALAIAYSRHLKAILAPLISLGLVIYVGRRSRFAVTGQRPC